MNSPFENLRHVENLKKPMTKVLKTPIESLPENSFNSGKSVEKFVEDDFKMKKFMMKKWNETVDRQVLNEEMKILGENKTSWKGLKIRDEDLKIEFETQLMEEMRKQSELLPLEVIPKQEFEKIQKEGSEEWLPYVVIPKLEQIQKELDEKRYGDGILKEILREMFEVFARQELKIRQKMEEELERDHADQIRKKWEESVEQQNKKMDRKMQAIANSMKGMLRVTEAWIEVLRLSNLINQAGVKNLVMEKQKMEEEDGEKIKVSTLELKQIPPDDSSQSVSGDFPLKSVFDCDYPCSFKEDYQSTSISFKEDYSMGKRKSIPRFDSLYFFLYPHNSLDPLYCGDDEFRFQVDHNYLPCTTPLSIVKGQPLPLDVSDLLSNRGQLGYLVCNNGDRVGLNDAISGKYLLIYCVYVPVLVDSKATFEFEAAIRAYSKLTQHNNFEMVLVAKMRSEFVAEYDEYTEQEAAFNHLFSALPCLAIPFSHSESRNSVCDLVGLGSFHRVCLFLDPDQKVLRTHCPGCLYEYGGAAFPFTKEHLLSLERKDEELKMRLDPIYRETRYYAISPNPGFYRSDDPLVKIPLSLEELLCCEPNTPLERCGRGGEKVTVSELSKKRCVVLYLCYDGCSMKEVGSLCRKHDNNKYEIVLVPNPIYSDESSYSKALDLALQEEKNISSSWWKLPFVDEVSRRLYRLSTLGSSVGGDRLIVWADGGTNGELNALPLTRRKGYDTYPCTRKQWLDDMLSNLGSLTIESILGESALLLSANVEVHLGGLSILKGRNVLLFFSLFFALNFSTDLLVRLRDDCNQIMKEYPGCIIIFVPMDDKPLPKLHDCLPCPRLSLPPAPKVARQFKNYVVAFGADNKMKSLHRWLEGFSDKAVRVSLFDDTLCKDLRRDLLEELDTF